jgi:phospholipid/cholesterol/gamma-HCH transport system substrate-binding protein
VVAIAAIVLLTAALYSRSFTRYVPVTLTADRAGLVMETGAKVMMNGVQVGRVTGIAGGRGPATLDLEIAPDQLEYIPANAGAQIRATTVFGAKYVDLIFPENPSPQRLSEGAVLYSSNVTTEVNTVFESLVGVLHQIDPAKLNAVLSALSEAFRGQGQRIGQATTDANQVLMALNSRADTQHEDWRAFKGLTDTYGAAADNLLAVLDASSTTSSTITAHASALDTLLVNTIGFAQAGTALLAPNQGNLVNAINLLEPTTALLLKYSPEYACTLIGAKWRLDHGGYETFGGNGYSVVLDAAIQTDTDKYNYPDNLPIVAAKGGPGGQPGCGSLPDASKLFPVRALVTNTGWGTGLDYRPNPGVAGQTCYVDYLPVTRAIPQPPSIRDCLPGPAVGPVTAPGMPPYGASLYGPGGVPLWPGLPPAGTPPPVAVPGTPVAPRKTPPDPPPAVVGPLPGPPQPAAQPAVEDATASRGPADTPAP